MKEIDRNMPAMHSLQKEWEGTKLMLMNGRVNIISFCPSQSTGYNSLTVHTSMCSVAINRVSTAKLTEGSRQ